MQDHEQRIIDVLSSDTIIFDSYDQEEYHLVEVGKPFTPGGGECKTDVYALYENMDNPDIKMELKISAKKQNAEFLANKLTSSTASAIFGRDWVEKINNLSIRLMEDEYVQIYQESNRKGEQGIFTLGYRLDLMNTRSGILSSPAITTYEEKLCVLSGRDEYGSLMSEEKTNPFVNGRQVMGAGIADYMFCDNDYPTSAQEIYDGLVPVEDYAYQMGDIYCALKAVNYRMSSNKADSRWFAVSIAWNVDENGILYGYYNTESPLCISTADTKRELVDLLSSCGICSPDQLIPGKNINPYSIGF